MEEKKFNSGMYDANGSFIPQTGSHGNVDGNLAHLRNTYMEAEREYFEYLLSNESIRNEFISLLDVHADNLFGYALKVQELLEFGELESSEEKARMQLMSPEERDKFHMQKLERAEGIMCLLFAAAKDKVYIYELVRQYSGRSR